ncbi:MAG: hypothetical protein WC790_01150 [Candidatus Paceibacterota bacterium]|jgi:cell division protein FtsB
MHTNQWQKGILVGILLLVSFWLLSLIWGLAGKAHVAISQAREVEQQYRSFEDRKIALTANLEALATERGRDAAIRTAFGVARPGEEVIVVVPPSAPVSTSTQSWWEKVLSWFSE